MDKRGKPYKPSKEHQRKFFPIMLGDYLRWFSEIDATDPERAHAEADVLLIEALEALSLNGMKGAKELAKAWKDVEERADGFWYA